MPKFDDLTPEQQAFVHYVSIGMSDEQAKVKAGYSANTKADYVKSSPNVKRELAKIKARTAKMSRMTREKVIEGFQRAIDDAKLQSDPQAQISGWREIGKMCGFYEPEKKVLKLEGRAAEVQRQLENLTQEELMALMDDAPLEAEYEEIKDDAGKTTEEP